MTIVATRAIDRATRSRLFSPAGAIGAFALIRLATMVLVAVFRPGDGPLLPPKGDIAWYTSIAQYGYDDPTPGSAGALESSNLAFFPLTSWLSEPFQWVGVPADWSLVIVATLASGFAAWAIYLIGELVRGPRVGLFLAATWGCLMPASIALSLPLSESVYTALAAWALLAMLRRELLTAGLLTACAGLSRPSSMVLWLPLIWVAVSRIRAHDRPGRAILAVLIGPMGFLAYVAFVGLRVGRVSGYLTVQKAYGSKVDWGVSWFGTLWRLATEGPGRLTNWVTLFTVIGITVSLLLLFWIRPPVALVLFVVASLILIVVQTGHLGAVQRFVVPLFPLLLPVAVGLAKLRRPYAALIIAVATLATSWYGAHLLYVTKMYIV